MKRETVLQKLQEVKDGDYSKAIDYIMDENGKDVNSAKSPIKAKDDRIAELEAAVKALQDEKEKAEQATMSKEELLQKQLDAVAKKQAELDVKTNRVAAAARLQEQGITGEQADRILDRIVTPDAQATEGTVTINGHDIFEEPMLAKSQIGYLPEIPPVYPDMTVKEYLNFAADLKHVTGDKKKRVLERALKQTDLSDVQERMIRNLSKGYKQRVGLAQAILGDPEVIILDEPSVGLDPGQIVKMRELIRSLGKEHTVILSSHILNEISEISDHILMLCQGKLVANDTPEKLVERYNETQRISMVVEGNATAVEKILKGIAGVADVQIRKEEEKLVSLDLETFHGVDLRRDLALTLQQKGYVVLETNVKRMSLEDVFLHLTERQGA